jgi:outer membrane protein
LTLRFPIADFGNLLAYAGAGLNRTVYFAESNIGEIFTSGHGRHRSLGAAAELGAQWRVTEHLAMSADLRWFDLAGDAGLLRSGNSLVVADPLALGVSLGWRFR